MCMSVLSKYVMNYSIKKYILKSAVNNPNRIPKLIFVHPDMNISLVICLHSVLSIQHGYNVQIAWLRTTIVAKHINTTRILI